MKNNDKLIAAFLVSLGLFSTIQAEQYVGALSSKEKNALSAVADADTSNVDTSDPSRLTANQDN